MKRAAMLVLVAVLSVPGAAAALTLQVTSGGLSSSNQSLFDIGYTLIGTNFTIGPQGDQSAYGSGNPPGSFPGASAFFTAPLVLDGVHYLQPFGSVGTLQFTHEPLGVWGNDGATVDRPFTMTGGMTVIDPLTAALLSVNLLGAGTVHAEFHLVQVSPPPFGRDPIFTVAYQFPEASSLLLLGIGVCVLGILLLRRRFTT